MASLPAYETFARVPNLCKRCAECFVWRSGVLQRRNCETRNISLKRLSLCTAFFFSCKGEDALNLYAVWPYFAVMAGALLVLRIDPIFRVIDAAAPDRGGRFSSVDGLRGLLAFGVFGHHAVVTHEYLRSGTWNYPPSVFYRLLGEVSVALFFAITGFLFWRKLLHARGAFDWVQLYIGRFFRIAPVYLVAVSGVMLVVLAQTNFELREPPHLLFGDVARWLSIGILGQPDVNGYEKTGLLMAGVTWTLRYEWLYYFSLPLLALVAGTSWHFVLVLAGLTGSFTVYACEANPHVLYASLFLCGMVAALLMHAGFRIPLRGKLGLAVGALCLGLLFTAFYTAKGIVQVLLIGAVFCVFISGNTMLGILGMKAVRRLGEISYSVYLLHGLVLSGVFAIAPVRNFGMQSNGHYWLVVAVCGVLVIFVASLSYLLVERPGIDLGRKVAMKTQTRVAAWMRSRCARRTRISRGRGGG
jgi:peptidoglycan/LPS O-acetylase OafA/YrhL